VNTRPPDKAPADISAFPEKKKNLLKDSGALGFYILLVTIVTYPLPFVWRRQLLGHFGSGEQDGLVSLFFIWKLFVAEAYRKTMMPDFSPLDILEFINHVARFPIEHNPGGYIPFIIMPPLEKLFPLPGFYNLFILGTFILNGFCFFLLANYLFKHRAVSWILGAGFALSPYLIWHYSQLRIEQLNMYCIPLFILFLLKTVQENTGQWKNAAICGFFLGLTSLFYWYYGMFAVFFAIIYILFHIIQYYKKPDHLKKLIHLLLATFVFALVIFPSTIPYMKIYFKGERHPSISAARGYFTPGKISSLYQKNTIKWSVSLDSIFKQDQFYSIPIIYTLLALLSLFRLKKVPLFWYGGYLFFFLLSLGPYLKIGDKLVTPCIRLPVYELFYNFVPFFSRFQWPDRIFAFVMFITLILAGYGLKIILDRAEGRLK